MKSRVIPAIYIEFKPARLILGCYAFISISSKGCLQLVPILLLVKDDVSNNSVNLNSVCDDAGCLHSFAVVMAV
jgi:hypothetical protein